MHTTIFVSTDGQGQVSQNKSPPHPPQFSPSSFSQQQNTSQLSPPEQKMYKVRFLGGRMWEVREYIFQNSEHYKVKRFRVAYSVEKLFAEYYIYPAFYECSCGKRACEHVKATIKYINSFLRR